jgi:hypothetical protein
MIVKVTANRRPQFLLVSSKGKILGKHRTIAEAKSQERAIQISKARAAGHRILRRT